MHKTLLVGAALLSVAVVHAQAQTPPVQAAVSVCFVPSASAVSCTDQIVHAIDSARSEIRVISYELTMISQTVAVERDGQVMSSRTDGDAVVPLPAMSGDIMLEAQLADEMVYVMEAEPKSQLERSAA
jgi:hypothetical protein